MAEQYSHVHIDEKRDAADRVASLVRAPAATPERPEPPPETMH